MFDRDRFPENQWQFLQVAEILKVLVVFENEELLFAKTVICILTLF